MEKINEIVKQYGFSKVAQFESENRGIYMDGKLIMPFKDKSETQAKHNLYIYYGVELDNGCPLLKFGKCKTSIFERYKTSQDAIKPYNKCIWTGISEFGDEYGHQELQRRAKIHKMYRHLEGECANGTDENYEMIYGYESMIRFIQDVEDIYNTSNIREDQPLYKDIFDSVKDIFLNNKKWNILYFCPRAGKTRTNLSLCQLHNKLGHRISIMFSYVGTVRNSYLDDIFKLTDYENIKFIDIDNIKDNKDTVNEIDEWLNDENNHVMLYFALTGDTKCFNRRKEILNKLKKYSKIAFIEEADFGAHCNNEKPSDEEKEYISQLSKIHTIVKKYNIENIYVTTGTGYEKLMKFVDVNDYKVFVKEYFSDILCI